MRAIISDNVWSVVWAAIYHKSVLTDLKFPTGYNYEDVLFTSQVLSKVPNIVRTTHEYYVYRYRPESITHQKISFRNLDLLAMTIMRSKEVAKHFPELNSLSMERFWGITINMYNDAIIEQNTDVAKALYTKVKNEYRINYFSRQPLHDKTIPLIRRITFMCCGISFKTTCAIKRVIFTRFNKLGYKMQKKYRRKDERV